MNDDVPIWAKGIFWLCGLCNALLGAMGGYSLFSSVYWVHMRHRSHPLAPYFWAAFAVMELINVAFLSTFLLAAFQFFRLKPSAVSMHSVPSAALVGYAILNGMLWLIPGSIGTSVAPASGVGNMGIAPLLLWSGVPVLYPVASTIVLQLMRWRLVRQRRWPSREFAAGSLSARHCSSSKGTELLRRPLFSLLSSSPSVRASSMGK
jgi:hypothetical protein